MAFSSEAWSSIESIYQAIIEHPFNRELAEGILAKERFQFYMKQDALYLVEFARSLALAASKSPNPDDLVLLLEFSKGAIVAERGLHEYYFKHYEITLDVGPAPGCFNYTNFLISAISHGSYEVGIAALLPCFWIYREVGQYIHKNAKPDNPYQKWINTYSGDEFAEIVQRAIALTDRVADKVNEEQRGCMKAAFTASTRLEWLFWDSAYRMEFWPPTNE